MKIINHWKHNHFIILGVQWEAGYKGERTLQFTILNFGIEFKTEKRPEPLFNMKMFSLFSQAAEKRPGDEKI